MGIGHGRNRSGSGAVTIPSIHQVLKLMVIEVTMVLVVAMMMSSQLSLEFSVLLVLALEFKLQHLVVRRIIVVVQIHLLERVSVCSHGSRYKCLLA